MSILLARRALRRLRCYSIIKPEKPASATRLMARVGFPSSRVTSQQLVPWKRHFGISRN